MRKHWAESIEDVPELAEFDKQLDFPGLLAAAAVPLQRRLFAGHVPRAPQPLRDRRQTRPDGLGEVRRVDFLAPHCPFATKHILAAIRIGDV